MTMPRGMVGPQPQGAIAPASWWEWIASHYPPDEFLYNWQAFGSGIVLAGAGQANAGGNFNFQVPTFVYRFITRSWITASGAIPAFPVLIGLAMSSSNDWLNGTWPESTVSGGMSGTGQTQPTDVGNFPWPREVSRSTQLALTVNNSLNAAVPVSCVGILWGLEMRQRTGGFQREQMHQAGR